MGEEIEREYYQMLDKEAIEEFESLKGKIEAFLDSYPKPKTSVCGCGREMVRNGGFLYCPECRVAKVADARQVFRNVWQPYIPVYFGKVIHED